MRTSLVGKSSFGVLEKLDNLTGRLVDNAGFFAVENVDTLSDAALYELLLGEYPDWLRAARTAAFSAEPLTRLGNRGGIVIRRTGLVRAARRACRTVVGDPAPLDVEREDARGSASCWKAPGGVQLACA